MTPTPNPDRRIGEALPQPFTYQDHDAGTIARWTPVEVIMLRRAGEVIICAPNRTPFRRSDCINKHRWNGVITP